MQLARDFDRGVELLAENELHPALPVQALEILRAQIAAQVGARFRYLIECVEDSPQADELLSEHQLQTRDLYQSFVEHNADLRAETIDRVCTRQGLALQSDMTSRDLAHCIQTAVRGFNNRRLEAGLLRELDRMVRLLVAGAIAPAVSQFRAKRRSR